jgi:hypothetical protein
MWHGNTSMLLLGQHVVESLYGELLYNYTDEKLSIITLLGDILAPTTGRAEKSQAPRR